MENQPNNDLKPGDNIAPPDKPGEESNQPAAETPVSPVVTGPKKPNKVNWRLGLLGLAVVLLLGIGTYLVLKVTDVEDTSQSQTEVVKNEIPLLRIALQDGPLNEFHQTVQTDGALTVNNQMYEGLVTYENINKLVPLLAESWTNPDNETWVLLSSKT